MPEPSDARRGWVRTEYAPFWSEQAARYGFADAYRALAARWDREVPAQSLCLDAGIGTGFPMGLALAPRQRLAGVDLSRDLLRSARAALPPPAGRRLAQADLANLPFRTASFDLVYCLRSSWYVADLGRLLSELARVARPGGWIVCDFMNAAHPPVLASFLRQSAVIGLARLRRAIRPARRSSPIPIVPVLPVSVRRARRIVAGLAVDAEWISAEALAGEGRGAQRWGEKFFLLGRKRR